VTDKELAAVHAKFYGGMVEFRLTNPPTPEEIALVNEVLADVTHTWPDIEYEVDNARQ
jgi:hypothetical protein